MTSTLYYRPPERDPASTKTLIHEVTTLIRTGDKLAARMALRKLVQATGGFDDLAVDLSTSSKHLQRELSKRGDPSLEDLTSMLELIRRKSGAEG